MNAASSGLCDYDAQVCSRMSEAVSHASTNLTKARAGQKAQYDRSHREVHYQVGDLVLRRNHVLSDATKGISASLSAKWSGPYRVETKMSPLVYKLVDSNGRPSGGPVNVSDLKPFVARSSDWEKEEKQQAQPSKTADFNPRTRRYNLRKRS